MTLIQGRLYIDSWRWIKEFGWLVVLGLTALWDSISVYIGPSPREREKEKRNDRREKNVQTTPTRTTASEVGPCPTINQISRTPRHWKFTQHHRTTRPPPESRKIQCWFMTLNLGRSVLIHEAESRKVQRWFNMTWRWIKEDSMIQRCPPYGIVTIEAVASNKWRFELQKNA